MFHKQFLYCFVFVLCFYIFLKGGRSAPFFMLKILSHKKSRKISFKCVYACSYIQRLTFPLFRTNINY